MMLLQRKNGYCFLQSSDFAEENKIIWVADPKSALDILGLQKSIWVVEGC